MIILRHSNTFLVGLVVLSGLFIPFYPEFKLVFFTLLLVLGIFQASTGIILFILYPNRIGYQLYAGGLVLFALLCLSSWLWIIPILPLAMYYTYILHINSQPLYT
jgi:hypothetical protein